MEHDYGSSPQGNAFEQGEELVIKPTSDLFIGVFLSNPNNEWILVRLLNAVLQDSGWLPIVEAKVLNPISLQDYSVEKRVVLDVRVKDERQRFYNIEVQTSGHPAFAERILLGWAKTYGGQAARGGEYSELRPVFTIVITEFSIFPDSEKLHLRFTASEVDEKFDFCEHLQVHVLRLYPVIQGALDKLKTVSPKLAYWMIFLIFGRESEEKMTQLAAQYPLVGEAFAQPEIREAAGQFDAYIADPVSRNMEERRRMYEFYQSHERGAIRREALETGRAEGKAEGRAEGLAESAAVIAEKDRIIAELQAQLKAKQSP